ncbi:MAG: hypothetical protein EZS28_028326 [Streblomastix strix]|uniref:Uncharacterized protein n=1 Tax=Streblomastix strix TaxID=222440 RepID=A0A5J4V0B9_9EUKA|nr:MAG: hypothetical protein EZS28_028326 [Streblomastix strix]
MIQLRSSSGIIGVSNEEAESKSYPALSNAAHPDQSALNIFGAGIHVQHFIFEYIPPVSLSDSLSPMISINSGSLFDWEILSGGQRDKTPIRLIHSFTDCVFEGSSVDYNTKKSYGYTIGSFLSIIGASVKIDNCHFTSKENMNILKGIPSVIVSTVYIYADSGITVTNCKFENLTQGKTELVNTIKETGITDLVGNDQLQLQRLNNLPPSLAIFAITDPILAQNRLNAETKLIAVKQTHFTRSQGTTARSGALLVDGFILGGNIKKNNKQPNLNINNLYSSSSNSNLSVVILNGNEFESTEGLNSAAIALGSGINYGLITNTRFSKSETTNKKITQINFESSENVAESGGADQIIGDGNVYVPPSAQQSEQTDLLTKGLFTVEGKKDEAFDSASKKVTVIIEEQEQEPSQDVDVEDKTTQPDTKKSKNNNVLIIIVIIAVSIVLVIVILIIVIIAHKKIMKKEEYKRERREERRREMDELNDDEVSM